MYSSALIIFAITLYYINHSSWDERVEIPARMFYAMLFILYIAIVLIATRRREI